MVLNNRMRFHAVLRPGPVVPVAVSGPALAPTRFSRRGGVPPGGGSCAPGSRSDRAYGHYLRDGQFRRMPHCIPVVSVALPFGCSFRPPGAGLRRRCRISAFGVRLPHPPVGTVSRTALRSRDSCRLTADRASGRWRDPLCGRLVARSPGVRRVFRCKSSV